jgi:CheY-like chemotaxis protein
MTRFLNKEGFCVRTASGGEEGLRLAAQLKPAAITLDVMMPDMDGWSVLTALKADAETSNIPVIMLTMVDDRKRGSMLGASDYATKPVDREGLTRILKKYSSPSQQRSVLLIEDDIVARRVAHEHLSKEGWDVTEAANGIDALECMEREVPSLIVLDLMMPEMNGFDFVARVQKREEWRSIPIVVITARNLSSEDLMRLNGYVETVLPSDGDSFEGLLGQVRDLLRGCTAPLSVPLHAAKGGERASAGI